MRSVLHRMGYRFRLHQKNLPGRPDIVLPRHKAVVFVHGCYWHRHSGCQLAYTPKSNQKFWTSKFTQNVNRDTQRNDELSELGWRVITIWECETKEQEDLAGRLKRQLLSVT